MIDGSEKSWSEYISVYCTTREAIGKAKKKDAPIEASAPAAAVRKRLPKARPSITTSFAVGGAEGYMTAGAYADGALGEVFLKLGKQGSTLAGVMDAFSIAVSIGLQYGVPLETFVEKFTNLRFEPAGMTDDADIRMAQSMMDYIFRRLALDYMPFEQRSAMGLYTSAERQAALDNGGTDNGAPGPRHGAGDYYGAFVLDPDGNNIEAVYHGPHARSADSVEITFDD